MALDRPLEPNVQLGRPSTRVRASSAVLAVSIALLSLFVLRGARLGHPSITSRSVGVLVFLPVMPRSVPAPSASPRKAVGVATVSRAVLHGRTEQSGRGVSLPRPPAETEAATSTERSPETSSVAAAASAPASQLDLSDRVLRAAIVDTTSPIRRMAEASQQALDSPRPAPFANAIGEAAVPGCLSGNALKHDPPPVVAGFSLAGLLAIPFLVHAVATGKCKS